MSVGGRVGGAEVPRRVGMVGEAKMRQVSLGSSILPFLRPLSPTQVGP